MSIHESRNFVVDQAKRNTKNNMALPTFPRRHPAPPETQEECDEAIAYWSAMSEMTGLPVTESDGSSTLDKLLELRPSLPNANCPDAGEKGTKP
jgi:hypothetical protein